MLLDGLSLLSSLMCWVGRMGKLNPTLLEVILDERQLFRARTLIHDLQFSGYELGFHYLLDEKTKKQDLRE